MVRFVSAGVVLYGKLCWDEFWQVRLIFGEKGFVRLGYCGVSFGRQVGVGSVKLGTGRVKYGQVSCVMVR